MMDVGQMRRGMLMPPDQWSELNGRLVFEHPELLEFVAAFPPEHLMQNVSGLTSRADFAAHGVTIFKAVQDASPRALSSFGSVLDFGCGCGRLARMFKGHPGRLAGCDVDARHVEWVNANLPNMLAFCTVPNAVLPFADSCFDCIISISVFTHLDEAAQHFYLRELTRCSRPGSYLFLTIHGERAMQRALSEESIFTMLAVPRDDIEAAAVGMRESRHAFILQPQGHLTTEAYRYGMTFIPAAYVRNVWIVYFDIVGIVSGAIHDFQDIVVCRTR